MSHDSDQEESIFIDALEITDPSERARFVKSACADDPELLGRVEALLGATHRQDVLFPPDPSAEEAPLPDEDAGSVIGAYKLLERIGEGGCGVVYMAEQEQPVRRKVALKIVKLGMDTKQVIARFEAERQALAMMDHPSIATVLDAGATDTGRLYFVMELVRGVPITKFCDEHQLATEERLDLFLEVCGAVQHAHQKGIIHRDLKPSNILVTLHGRKAVPKVIDFGIAKATQQRLTDKTLFTRFHLFIGTPEYMSPEQAEMSGLDIDIRSDIYSLGVLLYELLTGSTPLPRKELLRDGYDEMRRMIREKEPERPSTRLTESALRKRRSELELRQLRGDLDRIVMKAIDKDRANRYDSADAFAQDIQRFLRHEPVVATAPTALYRFCKFTRRNRTTVTAGASISLALVVGLVVATLGLSRAKTEAIRAQEQAAAAEAVLEFLNEGLFAQVDPFIGNPERAAARDLKLLSAIESAAQGIEDQFRGQPQIEAALRLTLGRAFRRLTETETAQVHLERAEEIYVRELGPEDPKSLEARQEMAWLLIQQTRLPEAEALSQEILEIQRRIRGPDHERTLEAMASLGHAYGRGSKQREALTVFQDVVRRARRLPETDPLTVLSAMSGSAWAHYKLGEFDKKLSIDRAAYETALEALGPDHPVSLDVVITLVNDLHVRHGAFGEADRLGNEAKERCIQVLGEDHPTTLHLLSELTILESVKGLNATVRKRELVERSESALGSDNPRATFEKMRLGLYLAQEGHLEEGTALLEETMETLHRTEGPDTLQGRRVMRWLSRAYIAQGRYSEAEQLRTRTAEACQRLLGMESGWTHSQVYHLANLYARQGKWVPAARSYRGFLPYAPADYGPMSGIFAGLAWKIHAAGFLASRMAQDAEAVAQIAGLMLERYGDTDSADVAFETALPLLLVPGGVSDAPTVDKLVDLAVGGLQDPLRKRMLSGVSAFRRGSWDQARDHLTPLARNRDGRIASLSGSFLAMAQRQSGAIRAATNILASATARLEGTIRPGDLGNTLRPGLEWMPLAAAILARDEAELLIHGRRVSPLIDADYLAQARQTWKPIRDLVDKANWAARRQEWAEAKDLFLEATGHDYFDWTAAVHHEPRLEEKMACVWILSGQLDRYVGISREILADTEVSQTESAKSALLSPDHPPMTLKHRALDMARWRKEESVRMQEPESAGAWRDLTLGMAEYRNGHFDQALAALEVARGAFNLNCSGTANAFAAMAEWELGRREAAERYLAAAAASFQQLLDGRLGDLGSRWSIMVIFEIALNEARSIVR